MASYERNSQQQEMPEERLWRAVIASTVQEWIHGPLRQQREAEHFLFSNHKDFRTVCYSAGIDPANLRDRLEKFRSSKETATTMTTSRN
jgi:hypothetical protein